MSFYNRHIGIDKESEKIMLDYLGVSDTETLIKETIPNEIRLKKDITLEVEMSEAQFLDHIYKLSQENKYFKNYIGRGYHESILPPVIQRNILENPGWYTAYTPYQAEVAQGRLEALLNYQTVICDLTGMELSNASLLDEGTSAAEAMTMLFSNRDREKVNNNCNKFFVADDVFDQTLDVLMTRAEPLGIEIVKNSIDKINVDKSFFGIYVQYTGKNGQINDLKSISKAISNFDIKLVVAADLLSLTTLEKPSLFNCDVVVGTSQRFGIPLGYGGPHAGYFATKKQYKRSIPGRIIGVSKDTDGNRALRMALQTREQHIKRERATSNICTAQVLLAVMAGMYAVYHGPDGLKKIGKKINDLTKILYSNLNRLGIKVINNSFFDTIHFEINSDKIRPIAEKNKLNFNYVDENEISISINESTELDDIKQIVEVVCESTGKDYHFESESDFESIPNNFSRKSEFLKEEVFNKYRSETSMMRYIKSLERKDLSLNHSMIALGSCTMKLNAAAEMLPLSWKRWNNIHPFAPIDQTNGYQIVLNKLEKQLNEITGFHATSLQPNSGAQGEYAGLMVIRSYFKSINQTNRNICIIPSSAHGTNPASAVMAGMKVVVVGTDKYGNINEDELKLKAEEHSNNLAALMITYPSTHGVFESSIKRITDIIHKYGGQVYMDGANMNAQVGLTNPYQIGADVCHLNLHKTFAIPHGGGGPGVGPICVREHLSDFLPQTDRSKHKKFSVKAISSAPWGSAMACLISYAYICMMGSKGLKRATEIAILNANYIKKRIEKDFKILYTGELGRSAHEMIIDCRDYKEEYGIGVMDIAKRLIDYGFHAPTVSFPVPGTMMIEPTESENLDEIDRFCDALISIKAEIITCSKDDTHNILKNSPHTLETLTGEVWNHNYSRKEAAYPLPYLESNKFWPTVTRIDDAFGDRNLICTCNPIEDYIKS
jgi:glycine dehydrogenase